ncbi:MAG TPA: hypothetical protein VFE06_09215 [Acidobacteriaceae bacterium]|nr:hypothetical protein [Acidobacteriaceae bacterium]
MKQPIALLIALLLAGCLSSCAGSGKPGATIVPAPAPTISSGFPYQQGWLGADGAYSVPLGNRRSLWFFDDSFIGAADQTSRLQPTRFIHNSIGISNCNAACTFQYFWSGMSTGTPGAVFIAPGSDWFWPMDGFVYKGKLYVALMQMHAAGSGAFGFAYSGAQLATVSNYTAPPPQWSITYQPLNTGGTAVPGVSIVVQQGPGGNPDPADPQGANYAYFFTAAGSPPCLALLRIPLADLDHLARPGNSDWQYRSTSGAWETWPDTATTLPGNNAPVINPGATEMTVRWHNTTRQWLAVYPLGLRKEAHYSVSASLTGVWGPSESLYPYPELQPSNPNFTPNLFCYAVKEHVELEAAGQLVFTYACNSTVEDEILKNMNLYHPIMVRQQLPAR